MKFENAFLVSYPQPGDSKTEMSLRVDPLYYNLELIGIKDVKNTVKNHANLNCLLKKVYK